VFDLRKGKDVERAVRNAFAGQLPGKAPAEGLRCSSLGQIPRARGQVGFPLQHAPGKSMKIQGLLLMACI
jgi:hypothetical protein